MRYFHLKGITIAVAIVILSLATTAVADPCLVVYPTGPCVYHYDSSEYYTVGPGHPLYDMEYDRGGLVLLEVESDEIDWSIYQAPGLEGFEESVGGDDGYVFLGTDFELVVDGYSNDPTTFVNVIVVFDKPDPLECAPFITIGGQYVVGGSYAIGDLVVSTPTPYGKSYSDVEIFDVSWRGCYGVHVWAFSDENYNGIRDGGECFTAFSHDMVVPVEASSWGAIKSFHDK